MYQLLRSILFNFDPEKVHYFSMNWMQRLCKVGLLKKAIEAFYQPTKKEPIKAFGLSFPNVVGLGAGFDKNASYLTELAALGFGFVEIGTVTPKPQEGNEQPRLFRLPKDKDSRRRRAPRQGRRRQSRARETRRASEQASFHRDGFG